ncbi:uncharacterized protein LOC129617697 [Condylostylus longicornis]|uniref:uncharacterized protein LOC129617697 n=1 Tax=Condylostylus longicornis TaxID=2530218 RepID=UPI00244E36F4|nr:uncharacterized protein LOC129617697 [Condylostylus longicornis]
MIESFPFVRITVLGSSGCGKTSLIHSFVNNLCPHYHIPTTFPTLFYRTVRLPPESDQKGQPTSVCVEIEDTVAPEVAEEEEVMYVVVPEGCTDFTPFSIWKAPKTPVTMTRPVYIPLTQGRMAFIILFDSNEQDSLDKACQIHRMLMDDLELHKVRIRPYIYFVANKIEKDPEGDEHKVVIAVAEKYT